MMDKDELLFELKTVQATALKSLIELLKDVAKRVSEPGSDHPFSYLEYVVDDRLRALDPTALPPRPKMGGAGGPGGGAPGDVDMSDPQIQQLLRQLQQQQQGGGGAPMPAPGGPK